MLCLADLTVIEDEPRVLDLRVVAEMLEFELPLA